MSQINITDNDNPKPFPEVNRMIARFQSLVSQSKKLDANNSPYDLVQAEQLYSQARILAGQISSHYYGEYSIFKIQADQEEILTYKDLISQYYADKEAKAEAKLRKLELQKLSAESKTEYLKWDALFKGYESLINGLKDQFKLTQRDR